VYKRTLLLLFLLVFSRVSTAQEIRLNTNDPDSIQLLRGAWEFVWNKLLTPTDFQKDSSEIKIVHVPHSWRNEGHPDLGIGTYRTRVYLKEKLANHAILFSIINSSAKVWMNGRLIDSIGNCTADLKKYKAKFGNLMIAVPADTTSIELVVQVANFSYIYGGIGGSPKLGPITKLIHYTNTRKGVENFFVGSLIAMFFYQIILFFLYQQGKPYLYLGLICLNVALRAMVTHGGSFLLLDLFPEVSMEFWKKLEFLSVYSVVGIFPLYAYHLFPKQAFKKPILFFVACSVILCLVVVFTPQEIYYRVLDICHALLILGFIYTFIVIARAWRAGNKDASIILFGVLASFPFILLEIARNTQIVFLNISFPFLVEIGVLVFLLFQVYLLANHNALAYKSLERSNLDLEEKVQARTAELTKANQVREKLLSIVSHDVKGPLNSLRGVLDIYKQGGFSEEEMKHLAGKIEENMNTTSMLMDNILLWTKSQLKGVKISKTKFNLKELVEDHFKLFKTIADGKSVMLINSIGEAEVNSDKQILSLILRNLIANAIKFTFENGRIEVSSSIDESTFTIVVKDSGKGMRQEVAQSLFHESSSISTEGTRFEKGTGLGLALCYDYLKHLNGEISVQSELNKGTTFTIRIPTA
jgi:two-component system sensor histidine kinase ChiS